MSSATTPCSSTSTNPCRWDASAPSTNARAVFFTSPLRSRATRRVRSSSPTAASVRVTRLAAATSMSAGLAFVEGRYHALDDARISIFDPGFTHSDTVYDVTSVWKDVFFRLDDHVDRFLNSCRGFSIQCLYGA